MYIAKPDSFHLAEQHAMGADVDVLADAAVEGDGGVFKHRLGDDR